MLPILIDLGFIKIYTFGVFLVLAFFWGMFLLWRNIKLTSHKEDEIFDGFFFSLASALFFSRLLYVILHFKNFGFNILKFILINGYPGLTLYGGLLGGFLGLYIYCQRKKISFLSLVDYFIAPLFLAVAIGKLGGFLAGVEPGIQTRFILAVKYVGLSGLRHIPSLYEAILFFIGTYIAHRILFSVRRGTLSKGFSFYFFNLYFAAVYFLLDKLKQNHLYFSGINFNFFVSLILVFVFGVYVVYMFRKQIVEKTEALKIGIISYGKRTKQTTNRGVQKEVNGGGEETSEKN